MITEAIILAGGEGTRLRSEVHNIPKPMAPILGKPFLEILIELFHKKGIRHFVLSLGYKSEYIINHFSKRYKDIKISFSIEEKKLSTGGAIRLATTLLKTNHALILNGDSIFDIDIPKINLTSLNSKNLIIFGRDVEDASRYGVLLHRNGIVTHYGEKSQEGPGCINAGIYIISKYFLDEFELNTEFSIEKDFFSKITENDQVRLIIANNYFIDIGSPEDYRRAQRELHAYIQ